MYNRHPLGLKFQAPTTYSQLDQGSIEALRRSVNRISRTGGITRAVKTEVSAIYVASGQLASRSLTLGEQYASQSPQTEVSRAYFKALTERYLVRMLTVAELGCEALIRQSFGDYDR